MAGIRCSDLNSNNLLNNILYIESSQELLPTILERLEQKIDLNAKDSEGTSLIDQIKYSSMFKKHYKLILKNLIRLKVNLRLPMLHGHVEYQNLKS